MNLYYLLWVLLVVVSLVISLTGFFWALRHDQLSEQDRARYLPLRGERGAVPLTRGSGKSAAWEIAIMLGILFLGVAGVCGALVTMMLTTTGGRP